MESLVGKIAFLQPTGESLYGSGDYAIVQHTPTSIHGYKLCAGYDGHAPKSFPLVGKQPWEVVSVREGGRELLEHAEALAEFAREPERCLASGEKKHWIDSVYSDAAAGARRLKSLAEQSIAQEIAINETCDNEECDCDGTLYLAIPEGTRRVVIEF